MTDQLDHRLEELVNRLAASAPEAPPFPQPVTQRRGTTRRAPAWALAVAGAAAVLVVIGLPFLIFGGRTAGNDVAPMPGPTPTTLTPPATTTPPAPTVAACIPSALSVTSLAGDSAAGHRVQPLRFTNVSADACLLEDPLAVIGIGVGGEEVAAAPGTYAPIGGDADPLLAASDSVVMLVETGTGCEGGRQIGPAAEAIRISLVGGEVTISYSGDLGCSFTYSGFGEWNGVASLTPAEQTVVDAVRQFAADPTAGNHAAVPFIDTVTLTLGPALSASRSGADLADPAAWSIDEGPEGFRAYAGPFSALDLLAQPRDVAVTAGPHDHCAGPPMPVHEDLVGLRQISIQPTDATSCLEWWVVDLFLTGSGEIAGVTLDLWEP